MVLMLVAVFVLMGLVVDGGTALSAQQAASDEAEQAARTGAGALSVNALRNGVVQLNQQKAVALAESFTIAAGHPGTATASSGTVTVRVQYRIHTEILGIVGISTLPVSASASAVDVQGVSVGSVQGAAAGS
jgi:Flp pilus assembly protein TadG